MDENFNLDVIDKSFTTYHKGQVFDGVVVVKRENGCIFNIGGKNDAFIPASDFEDFDSVKIGDRFSVIITKPKNEDGLIEASGALAKSLAIANQNAESLKLGSRFTFVATGVGHGLLSRMGDYEIIVPFGEVSKKYVKDFNELVGKQFEAVVTEINHEEKLIVASVKLLEEQIQVALENNFWNSIFLNKVVVGKVVKIMPFGAFVNVDGVDCLLHISQIAHHRVENIEDEISVGEELQLRVIKIDKENKKVELSRKSMLPDPRKQMYAEISVGQQFEGEVTKLLQFGAIVKLENGATGLLHISNATDDRTKKIYEIVKVGNKVRVEVISKDEEEMKMSFKLIKDEAEA